MIGQSLPEYIFIRLSICCLRLIAPLSTAYVVFSAYHGHFVYSRALGFYALAEAGFYFLVFLPRLWLLQKAATHPPLPSPEERESLFAKCFSRVRDSQSAAGWFIRSTPEAIRRDNLAEWLLWAIFGTRWAERNDEWAQEIEGYLSRIENLLQRKLHEGWDQTVRCMKVTLDPVDAVHRPLLWYSIVALIDTITGLSLMAAGFRHYTSRNWTTCFPPRTFTVFSSKARHPDLIYWYRPHRSTTKHPILFLHGIGIGLWPYIPFLRELVAQDPDVGIIAIESLSISMRISPPPLSRPAMLEAIRALLDAYALSHVVVVGHSYGTVVAAHMLRSPELAPRVAAWLFVDPIPFLLHLPAVAYNFVYRPPRAANEWQLWYFASRDPDVARALARHFFWAENILWKEDLDGRRIAVVLSGCDQIVDVPEVREYLTEQEHGNETFRWMNASGDLEVLYYEDLDHAQVFDLAKNRKPLVDIVHKFVQPQSEPSLMD